jgi:hypothetical protein
MLSRNPNAAPLLKQNADLIYKINWVCNLNPNPNLNSHVEQINWTQNSNDLSLLEQNQHKIDSDNLSENPNAISLLQKNQDKIDWFWLSKNPSIFEPDYQEMSKKRTKIIYQELMEKALHPSRMLQWINEVEE